MRHALSVGGTYFLLSLSLGAAHLAFDRTNIEVELPIDSQEGRAVFPFKNTSSAPIGILEVRTECDCIQSSVSSREIEAGKTGEVALRFRTKLRNGTDLVRAKVIADNGEVHEISVTAKLHSYVEVSPLMLHWQKRDKRESKEFIISSTGLGKLRFTKVAAVKESKVEFWPGKEPQTIRVLVTPPAGDRPFQDILVVSVVVEGTNETKVYDLHVSAD